MWGGCNYPLSHRFQSLWCFHVSAASVALLPKVRLLSAQVLASTVALLAFGMLGAGLGGASLWRGGLRVVLGGWLAMGITYGFGRAFTLGAGGAV